MQEADDDSGLFGALVRESATMAQAFVRHMHDIEASPEEGFAIAGAFLAQICVSMTEAHDDDAKEITERIASFGIALIPLFADQWRRQNRPEEYNA